MKSMMKALVAILALTSISNFVFADELTAELGKMCNKLKTCSMEKVAASQDLSPEMKKQMEIMFEKSCESIEQTYISGIAAFPDHYKSALACVKSMANAPCERLMNNNNKSKECLDYEKLAEKGL